MRFETMYVFDDWMVSRTSAHRISAIPGAHPLTNLLDYYIHLLSLIEPKLFVFQCLFIPHCVATLILHSWVLAPRAKAVMFIRMLVGFKLEIADRSDSIEQGRKYVLFSCIANRSSVFSLGLAIGATK